VEEHDVDVHSFDPNYTAVVGKSVLVLAPKLPVLTELYESEIIPYTTSTASEIEEIVMSNSTNLFIHLWRCAQKVSI
jgi:hypothetical protein